MRFPTSRLYISVIPVIGVGVLVGFLSAIMGGGRFIMVRAMIYLQGMPTRVVVATSLFQIMFVLAFTTVVHAVESETVDIMLAVSLIQSGMVGSRVGSLPGAGSRRKACGPCWRLWRWPSASSRGWC